MYYGGRDMRQQLRYRSIDLALLLLIGNIDELTDEDMRHPYALFRER